MKSPTPALALAALLALGCHSPESLHPGIPATWMNIEVLTPRGHAIADSVRSAVAQDTGHLLTRYQPYVDLAVSGADCATATTVHAGSRFSVAFTDQGAELGEQHIFRFHPGLSTESEGPEPRELFGGTLQVLEHSATAWEFQIVGATRACDVEGTTCVDDPGPFWARVEGQVVSPEPAWQVEVSATARTPDGGAPLCVGLQPSEPDAE